MDQMVKADGDAGYGSTGLLEPCGLERIKLRLKLSWLIHFVLDNGERARMEISGSSSQLMSTAGRCRRVYYSSTAPIKFLLA
jgi:hypothetical protein